MLILAVIEKKSVTNDLQTLKLGRETLGKHELLFKDAGAVLPVAG